MNQDEFAFVNQQLAGMLKSGIPLEGALQQLCATMQRGQLREELEKLQADLAQGHPLRQAITARQLPDFYVRMIQVGAQSNDLPAMLTLLADYYQRQNFLWTRLKGLLVYPLIVLVASLALAIFLSWSLSHFAHDLSASLQMTMPEEGTVILLLPVVALCLLTVTFVLAISIPALRRQLRWHVAGFREANLSHFAATLQLLLKQGANLTEALALLGQLETGSPLGIEITRWQQCLASGRVKSTDLSKNSKIIPPLFFWLMAGDEENWITGLGRAADIYYQRATHKIEMFLYAVLPVCILFLGLMIISEIYPMLSTVLRLNSAFNL